MRSATPLTVLALLTACLAGCGQAGSAAGGGRPQAGPVTVQPVAGTGGGSPATSATPPSTQVVTTAASGGPAGRARDGDVDGDGAPDQMTLSGGGVLAVRYSRGGTDVVNLGVGAPGDQKLLGAVDADGDGRAEVFVRVVRGASAQIDTVLRYVDGHLRQMTMDGEQANLSYGASVRNQFAWACQPPTAAIVQWSSTSSDNDRSFQGEVRRYRFVGATMVLISREPFSIRAGGSVPGVPARSGCGSLVLSE